MRIYESPFGTLYNGDCLEIMPTLKEKVDLVLTDPPYNISVKNNFNTMHSPRHGVDFGEWDKNADIISFISLLPKILNKNGSVIIFNSWRNISDIARKSEIEGLVIKDCIRMIKKNPMPRNRDRRYIADYEFAMWAVMPNSKWVFNRQRDTYDIPEYVCKVTSGKEKTIHPTQKPLSVVEEMIKRHSYNNYHILECFMGSGTTCVAAIHTGRKFIGIEKEEKYFDIAVERVKEAEKEFMNTLEDI